MPNLAEQTVAPQPKLLPVVRRVIEQLDALYMESAGSVKAKSQLADVYSHWLAGGRTGPSGLRYYVQALVAQLGDEDSRAVFAEAAERVLIHLQSGYAN
jgi:hypothetical protein